MAVISKSTNKCWRGWEERGPSCTGGGSGAAPVENSVEVSQKIKNRTYDPAIPLLGIYLKKSKTLTQKDTWTSVFIAALFTVGKIGKQSKCLLVDDWIKKKWYIYTMNTLS